MKCKNLFSYPDGTIFTGVEILNFINYHLTNKTGKTKVAKYMNKKFGNIKSNMSYKFFKSWTDGDLVINKPRLLRTDHIPPTFQYYNSYYNTYELVKCEGCYVIRL